METVPCYRDKRQVMSTADKGRESRGIPMQILDPVIYFQRCRVPGWLSTLSLSVHTPNSAEWLSLEACARRGDDGVVWGCLVWWW